MNFPCRSLLAVAFSLFAVVASAQVPPSQHVYIVAEENRSYEHLVGSPSMPYLNSLISRGTLFTQFYANQHSSITDYFWVTAGQVPTTDNNTLLTYDVDNIVRRALQLNWTYKDYAQTLPYPGFADLYSGAYMKRHTALPYYSDMGNNPAEMLKLVPSDQMLTDIQNGTLPNFAFITPDADHDLHNCPTTLDACQQLADQFLQTYLDPLLARPEFQPGGDGLLIIWADEADLGTPEDNRCNATQLTGCGGRIAVLAIGPNVKAGYQSPTTYHHENVLRTMQMAMGEQQSFLGVAQNAASMDDMFIGNADGSPSAPTVPMLINVQSPGASATVPTQVHVAGTGSGPIGVASMQVYLDGKLVYDAPGNAVDTYFDVAAGSHRVSVKAWGPTGENATQLLNFTASAIWVTVQSPAASATVSTSMPVQATATGPNLSAMQVYVDGTLAYTVKASSINTTLPVSAGGHNLTVKAWDTSSHTISQKLSVTAVAPKVVGVTITSPAPSATVTGPVRITATGYDTERITATQIYVDGVKKYSNTTSGVNTTLTMSRGTHRLTVKIWDAAGKNYSATENITVN